MSTYTDYFKTLAEQHKDIRHDQPRSITDSSKRVSFFLHSDEQVFASPHMEDGLVLVLEQYRSRMAMSSDMDDYRTGGFEIRAIAGGGERNYTSAEAAQELCRIACLEIVAKCINDSENMEIGGHIPGFDPDQVRLMPTGPYANDVYGYACIFVYRAQADISHYDDLSETFIAPAP